jgi:hypothetical protein
MTYTACVDGETQAGFGIIAVTGLCRQRIIVNRCCIAGIYASNAVSLEETVSITPQNNRQSQ